MNGKLSGGGCKACFELVRCDDGEEERVQVQSAASGTGRQTWSHHNLNSPPDAESSIGNSPAASINLPTTVTKSQIAPL
jgi:hypothetical protein